MLTDPATRRDEPLFATTRIGRLVVRTFESAGRKHTSGSQDTALITSFADGTARLAAIDGVTPIAATPRLLGIDGARFGAAVVRTALLSEQAAEACLAEANQFLHRPALIARAQTMASVVVADISPAGRIRLVRGCDCEAWVRDLDGRWRAVFADAAADWAKAAWRDYLAAHPELWNNAPRRYEAEQVVWGQRRAWHSHPPGRVADPVFEVAEVAAGGWSAVLLCSDGLRSRELGPLAIDALIETLSDPVRPREHDDVTALVVTPL